MSDAAGPIIDRVLAEESGEFTNNPADSGGPTKWGITQAALSEFLGQPASISDVENLTRSDAWTIYYTRYVKRPRFDAVLKFSESIGAKLIDAGANLGPSVSAAWLQRALNAFNLNGTKYPDGDVDGEIGPSTLAALQIYLAWRGTEGERVLLEALNCLQGERYIEIAEKRPKDEEFIYGWLKERVVA